MIIGLIGNKGSGKDTVAEALADRLLIDRWPLADPIKRAVQIIFNFSDKQLHDPKEKEKIDKRYGVSPRHVFQKFGTEIFQYDIMNRIPELEKFGRNFWVYRLLDDFGKAPIDNIIVSDIRFPHEFDAFKERNFFSIRIYNPNISIDKNHSSEYEQIKIDETDYTIVNDSTLDDLYAKIDSLTLELGQKID
jgi:dephospho-CoA kinase